MALTDKQEQAICDSEQQHCFPSLHPLLCFPALSGTHPSEPPRAPEVGTEADQSTNSVFGFHEKHNSHGEELGLLMWQGEVFVRRVRLVIAKALEFQLTE